MTSNRKPATRGTRLARCARWLALDRNPLRRGTDRAEVAVRLATVLLLVVAVPVMALIAGRVTGQEVLRHARAQAATEHTVRAVLLRPSPLPGVPDPDSGAQVNWVSARWAAPDGSVRTGEVMAPAGARAGSTVRAWVNASGAITAPPPGHRQMVGDVFIAVTLTCIGSVLTVLGANLLARRALLRRRLSAWAAEWEAVGPLWTRHRT